MTLRLCQVLSLLLAITTAAAAEPTKREQDIRNLESYYARLYSQPLTMKARLPKLVALMSLAKLDSEPTSLALIEAAGNKDPLVAYLAWEILHARQASLTGANHDYWVKRGIELAAGGELPGDTIKPALDAGVSLRFEQVKPLTVKLFDLITSRYSPDREADVPVLKSAGALLAAWNEPVLLQRVAGQVNDKARGPAAEMILMSMPGAHRARMTPPPSAAPSCRSLPVPPATPVRRHGLTPAPAPWCPSRSALPILTTRSGARSWNWASSPSTASTWPG